MSSEPEITDSDFYMSVQEAARLILSPTPQTHRYCIDPEMEEFYGDDVQHVGDAFDLRASSSFSLLPGERRLIGTGFRVELLQGFVGLVTPRSGLAMKHGITVVNSPGLVDTGYRGEVKVILHNTDRKYVFEGEPGDRIAQFLIVPVSDAPLTRVDAIDTGTERGESGFGSTGVK